MENIDPNSNSTQPVPPVNPAPVAVQPPVAPPVPVVPLPKKGLSEITKEVLAKIKANKKLSILLISFVSIIVLIIVAGSIYSLIKNSNKNNVASVDPTPIATPEVMLSEESKKSESKLKELKDKIQNLDMEQKHLTPPSIDFDISF